MKKEPQRMPPQDEVAALYRQIKDGKLTRAEAIERLERARASLREPALSEADVFDYFRKQVASALELPLGRIEVDAPFERYGIDSVVVMQLTNGLEKQFGPLSKTLFFEYQTIEAIARYFLAEHRPALVRLLGKTPPAALPPNRPARAPAPPPRPAPPAPTSRKSAISQERVTSRDIAIVGVSGRYPQAGDLHAFWKNLESGKDCVTEIPAGRWDHGKYFDAHKGKPGKSYTKWGGFLDDVDQFDPLFFNISPREAELLDPQERLFLQCAYHTLEDAGYTRDALSAGAGRVGVFVGVMYEEYQLYGASSHETEQPFALAGSPSSIANRVSFFCNFHGPSVAVDTMCSSSLTAIHLACQSLREDECDLALAGGVNVSIHPNKYLALSQGQFASSTGRCETFGQGGDGYVPSEGVGAVLLKPLSRAEADGDHVYAVIKATSVNHGGRTNGYTVPNPNAQSDVIAGALEKAGVDPRTVSYIEAHGTGTSLGDPIEIAGLTKVFVQVGGEVVPGSCAIGSVKSNIGHCESAAGIAGITKVLLQMKHRQLAPSLHSRTLNPHIDFGRTPFRVQQGLEEWKRPRIGEQEYPRIAGVSSFGAGGANAHVILEEYTGAPRRVESRAAVVVVLSAKSEAQTREQAKKLLEAIRRERYGEEDLSALGYTLQVGREAMEERLATTVNSLSQLVERLERLGAEPPDYADWSRGSVQGDKETLSLFARDQDLQEVLRKWVSNGKLARVVDLWVKGLTFDWNQLYPAERRPGRLSLPGYPFVTKRYWIARGESTSSVAAPLPAPKAIRAPEPVIHSVAARTLVTLEPLVEHSGPSFTPSRSENPIGITLSPLTASIEATVTERREATRELLPLPPPLPAPLPPSLPLPLPLPVQKAMPSSAALAEPLRASLARALCAEAHELDPDKSFSELGLDSVVGVEWVRSLNKEFQLSLVAATLYDYPTLAQLARHMSQSSGAAQPAVEPAPVPWVNVVDVKPSEPLPDTVASSKALVPVLTASLSRALFADEADIDPDKLFADLGVDSVIAVEWIRKLNATLGLDLKATVLFDHATIQQLAKHLATAVHPPRPAVVPLPAPVASAPVPAAPLPEPVAAAPRPVASAPVARAVEPPVAVSPSRPGAIAIVGASGRYPGAHDLDEYWTLLASGTNAVREVPASRWNVDAYYQPGAPSPGKVYCKWLGALDDIDGFDPLFFNISPVEADLIDPQHRLFLEESHKAFEDAGYSPSRLDGISCGVYLGIMSSEYVQVLARHGQGSATGNSAAIAAGRIAYHFNLKGPAVPVDTACSSSLVAIHFAIQALQNGEIDMALAGGVALYLIPETYVLMCEAGMLSPEGKCKAFDNGANGFVPGEGVGVVVLKRLEDAERDGDVIQGVIIGSGINQDGKTNGITAPSMKSQAALVTGVHRRFGIDPRSISYVETHGTGTKLGDPIELGALSTAFGEKPSERQYCALGSVKSNLGHTSAAAGVAGIHKVLLCFQHGQLVPSLHFSHPNEHFDFEQSAFYVNTTLRPWARHGTSPRRAAVSSFGYSGTNAHVVIEEYAGRPRTLRRAVSADRPAVVVLSAKTEAQLEMQARRLLYAIEQRALSTDDLADVAYTLQSRVSLEERLAILASDMPSLVRALTAFLSGAPLGPNVQRSRVSSKKEPAPLVTGRPEELISHWLEGALQDWSPLYRDGEPARHLRLPTYPFAKQRCWAAAPAITPPRRERVRTTALEMALPHWAITEPKVDARWGAHRGLIVFGAERQAIRDAISAHAPHAQFLPPAHGRTVDELVELLRAAGPVDAVTWLLPEDATNAVDAESLVVEQSAGVRFGFRLVKALLALGYGTKSIRLNVVTWQTQSIRDEAVHPTHASVHGLIGSLAKEYPLWSVRLLDLPIERTEKTAALVAEGLRLETDAQGDALAWRSGRWYRPELLPVETPLHGEGITFRKDGVYVVVGGAGGLGEVLSEYLIREYQAKVVWIGRRPLDGTITSKLDRLGQLGVRPSYLQADAADASSLGRARRDILARHGAIHGVVHSAIVLRDKSLQNMDEPQFLASLSAKVDTSVRLAQAFGEDALDFVLFFSSMQTFFKAPGQSNYAAGCAFSDALAQRLKQTWKCAVKIMNWGYWGSVGIVADEAHHRRMAAIGMGSIEPDEGMDAVEHLLGAPVPQLAVVKRLHGAASSPKFFAPTATEATVLTVQSAPAMETLWGD